MATRRDERAQRGRSTYRVYRPVRTVRKAGSKRRKLRRLVIASGGGGLFALVALSALFAHVAGMAYGGAEAEIQSRACGIGEESLERAGPTRPGTGDDTPAFMFDSRNIARVAAQAGFTGEELVTAVAVARAESGGNPSAINTDNANGSTDYGLWQINSVHIGSGFDPARYRDPAYNATWAYRVYEAAGRQWTPWTVFKTGKYRDHLAVARTAVEGVGAVAVDEVPVGDAPVGTVECSSEMAVALAAGQGPGRSQSISGRAGPAIAFARRQLGDPYQWGAIGPDTWDCSSLVQAAWATAGVRLPRVSRDQFAAVTPVPRFDIHPGDLIFYGNPVVHHVVMYTGEGKIIEAPSAGLAVREIDVYWTDVRGVGRPAAS